VAASSSNRSAQSFTQYWPWFFFTAAFESLIAACALLLVPSESGLSLPRLAFLGILLLTVAGLTFLGLRARRNPAPFDSLARSSFILSATLLSLICSLTLFLLRYLNPQKLLPYYERVSPLLWVFLVISVQAIFFFNLVKNGFHRENSSQHKPVYLSALVAFCILFSVFLFVAISKIGITPDTAYWGEPGVAIQGWQFVISILAGILISVYFERPSRTVNIFIPLALYILASILWLSVPNDVLSSSFYAPITPPANIPFPYSDAGFYDYLSQSLLIGTRYLGHIPPRPFYVLFLAVLHFFFGQNYASIITAQTLVLAFFPVSVYFLAKKIHSPAAGVTVALFSIFRELTGLWISSNTRVVNSKILTTDFPTALGIAFTCLVFLWWLERRDVRSTLIAGGTFGLLLLFRTQSLFILPVVFLLAWFIYQHKLGAWILAGMVFAVAMLMTILPWLTHNRLLTGKFTFDDPNQVAIIYSQYSMENNLDLSQFNPQEDSVSARIVSFTLEHPTYVATFISAHFLNTEIGGLLSLPLVEHFESLTAPINLYWVGWDGVLEWYNVLLLIFYTGVIAFGLGVSWRRMGWLGLLPLGFNLGYALANGISRFSSWRYNLPVDWVIYFYFGVGALGIVSIVTSFFGAEVVNSDDKPIDEKRMTFRDFWQQYLFFLVIFALVGAFPWMAEKLTQPRYTSTQDGLIGKLASHGVAADEIESFMAQPDGLLMEGRLLYPRMYRRYEGMASANPWPAYAIRDFARMGFVVINDHSTNAIFMTRETQNFPQGADVIMLGCQRDGYVEARLLDFNGTIFQAAPLTDLCK
jgi:hypothetical protein